MGGFPAGRCTGVKDPVSRLRVQQDCRKLGAGILYRYQTAIETG